MRKRRICSAQSHSSIPSSLVRVPPPLPASTQAAHLARTSHFLVRHIWLLASPSSGQPAVESNFSCCACFCFLCFLSFILPHLGRLRASPPQCRSPRAPVAVTRPSLSLLRLPRPPPPPSRRSRSVVCEPPRYVLASLNWSSRYHPRDLLRAPVSRCLYRLRMLTSRPPPPVPLHQKCSPASRCRRQ